MQAHEHMRKLQNCKKNIDMQNEINALIMLASVLYIKKEKIEE